MSPAPISPRTWGGLRPHAGRKRMGPRSNTPHRARPKHFARHPVHVTMRSAFRPLRSQHVFPTLRIALARANRRAPQRFRIVHFSVQYDHVHLLVEARDKRSLSAGMRSVSIRIARYVNELLGRKGALWADRWFGRALTTPRSVRTALVYVLANFRKHARKPPPSGIDPFSSGGTFDGFRGFLPARQRTPWALGPPPHFGGTHAALDHEWLVRPARTDLGSVAWRRLGLLRLDEAPVPSRSQLD
jgi:REP element-mobilizing transposase RayT